MNIFKEKKKLIFSIFIDIFICVAILSVILICNRSVPVSTNTVQDNNNTPTPVTIPNVTKDNTTFKVSDTKNKVKNVNISATNRLEEYNLYYYITFDKNTTSDINDTDYSLLNDTILIIDENCTIYFKYGLDGNYSDDFYEITVSNIKVSSATSEKVPEKELNKQKVDKNEIPKSTSPYFIKVNYGANVVTIYTKDEDGNYTVPYKAMVCSCGTYTPKSGTYKTSNKYAWRPLIHNVYGQYATRIVNKILFHSVPYSTNKKDALLYKEYDKLGTKASEGCVRLTVKDAKWIYDNCPSGTMVEFYSNSNPGPLGKPTAQKISSVKECRDWDPTDPAAENPWHTYKKEEKPNQSTQNNIINNVTNNTIIENVNNSVINNSIISNSISNNNQTNTNTNTTINNSITNTTKPGNTTNTNPDNQNNNINNTTLPNKNNNTNNKLVNNVVQNVV